MKIHSILSDRWSWPTDSLQYQRENRQYMDDFILPASGKKLESGISKDNILFTFFYSV